MIYIILFFISIGFGVFFARIVEEKQEKKRMEKKEVYRFLEILEKSKNL